MSSAITRVARVTGWDGWCSPCEREDRPLVLTRSGGGVVAWLAGFGDDDSILLLTCRVCGSWQHVPNREEDDPEVVFVDDEVREAVAEIVFDARSVAAPVELEITAPAPVATYAPPAPRAEATPVSPLEALIEVVSARVAAPVQAPVPSPPIPMPALDLPVDELVELATEQPVAEQPVAELPVAEPVGGAPVALVPEPRPAVERIVTVPDSATAPAFSPEAVAAAAAVLAAARAETPAPAAERRGSVADRRHRARRGPTPRRSADRVAAVRAAAEAEAEAEAAAAALELPPVLGLPAGTRQLVLATAG